MPVVGRDGPETPAGARADDPNLHGVRRRGQSVEVAVDAFPLDAEVRPRLRQGEFAELRDEVGVVPADSEQPQFQPMGQRAAVDVVNGVRRVAIKQLGVCT